MIWRKWNWGRVCRLKAERQEQRVRGAGGLKVPRRVEAEAAGRREWAGQCWPHAGAGQRGA